MEILKKASKIISKKYINKVIILFFLMIVCILLETLGIALVLPALSFLAEGSFTSEFDSINKFTVLVKSKFEEKNLIIVSISFLLLVYFLKNIFLLFFTWWQKSLVDRLYRDICKRLIRGYMFQPYLNYLDRNSSMLARYFDEVKGFLKYIDNFIVLIVEIFVLIGIGILLLIVEPYGASIVVLVIGAITIIFNFFTKKFIDKWGKKRLEQSVLSLKSLLQALNSFKIIKVLGREESFISKYTNHNSAYSKVKKFFDILDSSNRFWLEFLGVFGLCFLTFILINKNDEVVNIIPTLGLFSAAAYRLLPSVTRILRSFQALNFSKPIVNTLAKELDNNFESEKFNKEFHGQFNDRIKLKNIFFKYPQKINYVLNDLSFEIKKGETIGIMGMTGSGKSTLIDIIIGLLKPEKGTVLIDGKNINEELRAWQNLIGYVPQSTQMIDDTIKNNILFGLKENEGDLNKIHKIIKITQLEKFIQNLPEGLETIVGDKGVKLSGGQQQRIGIARAIYHKPKFLIFDESSSALDTETEKNLMREIKEYTKGRSLLIVSHRKTTLEHCDKIYLFKNGQLQEELE
ncbi:ABC transporter ATP-binding protein [Candidatus Pelagibacter sp. Uisw_092]|uniref:ABC transporter ATP-binding protein n=1 Tax=Candidatus Pelagibacter sp. Uisw_092 TaxID=3230979 RepID=UPI0039E87A76